VRGPRPRAQEGAVKAENFFPEYRDFCSSTSAQARACRICVHCAHGDCACQFASRRSRRSLWSRNRASRCRASGSNRRRLGRCRVGAPVLGAAKQSAVLLDRQFLLPALPVLQWPLALLLSASAAARFVSMQQKGAKRPRPCRGSRAGSAGQQHPLIGRKSQALLTGFDHPTKGCLSSGCAACLTRPCAAAPAAWRCWRRCAVLRPWS
jgi:hypothetical protein